ncbi:hypothetical protein A2U01_0082205, partial [Trifolium medium]|nr:hypothetical protein [Trifolium medium]
CFSSLCRACVLARYAEQALWLADPSRTVGSLFRAGADLGQLLAQSRTVMFCSLDLAMASFVL